VRPKKIKVVVFSDLTGLWTPTRKRTDSQTWAETWRSMYRWKDVWRTDG